MANKNGISMLLLSCSYISTNLPVGACSWLYILESLKFELLLSLLFSLL